ncbi:MAG TPA: DUF308 domain-containing protein [Hanamia sp.]|jgi:uncharacterized membrane protein HdeD (DUF308 family)|nr:DUF308 domain-containing protein [Hanamia sp.]
MVTSKSWWLISLKAIIFIFLGIYIFKFPVSGMLGLIFYGGVCLFMSGIIESVFAITYRKIHPGWAWQMAEGLVDIVLAIILLSNLGLTAITLPFVFAFYAILTGIFWIFQALFFKKNAYKFWTVAFIAGLFSLLIGFAIFYRPVIAALTIVGMIGIMFMVHGFFLLLFSFEISGSKKKV